MVLTVLFSRTKFKTNVKETLGAARPQFRSLNRRKSASCGHCSFRLISPPMRFPPQAVIGGSSLDPHLRMELDAANKRVSRSCL